MSARTVFINGRYLSQPLSGVQRYAEEIVRALDRRVGAGGAAAPYTVLCPADAKDAGLRHIRQEVVGRSRGHVWDQLDFALAARRGVALCLASVGPILLSRQLVVIHDAAVQRHPEHFSRAYAAVHRTIDAILARRARLATVSDFSRKELSEVLRVASDRIIVARNGAEHFKVAPDRTIVQRLGLGEHPFFLALGNITRNKNLAVVIRAQARLQPSPVRLVAVGRLDANIFGRGFLPAIGEGLVLPGRLNDAEVAGLMRAARALIFPSFYEGFGIPPLEAMANDCPVLASTAEAVRETCGDAAEYFDPDDDATLATLMMRAVSDGDHWRERRIAAGRERRGMFSWADAAATLGREVEAMAQRAERSAFP